MATSRSTNGWTRVDFLLTVVVGAVVLRLIALPSRVLSNSCDAAPDARGAQSGADTYRGYEETR